jgi:DNA replication protein DnaC
VLARDVRGAYSCRMARADCPQCEGSGWKVVERTTEGAQALAADRPGAGVGEPKMVWAVPCDCTAGDRTERALQRARVPQHYRHCDFDSYETDNDVRGATPHQLAAWNRNRAEAKLIVQAFADNFPVGTEHGVLLMGKCGVGKTHLAIALLNQLIVRGHSGLFYDYGELLKEIQASYSRENSTSEIGVLDPVLKAEVLLLDDLGSSKPSMWALETVGHILSTRYNEKRFTIITTNYLDPGFAQSSDGASGTQQASLRGKNGPPPDPTRSLSVVTLPSGEMISSYREDTLEERVGKRIRSRLYEMCRTVEIVAFDYRKEIRHAGPYR